MVRRIEGWGAAALGRMDRDGAAALMRRAMVWTAQAGAMFLLCRVQAGLLAPFAMAFLAAALLTGRDAAPLLVGCLAGAMNGSLQNYNLRLPIGAAIVLGGAIAWDYARPALKKLLNGEARVGRTLRGVAEWLTGRRCPAPNRLARSPNGSMAIGAALAGTGVLIPGLALLGEALWPGAAAVTAASVAAVASAPFFQAALEDGVFVRRLTPEKRAGLCLLLGAMCAGVARLSAPVGLAAGGVLTLLLYPSGALAGVGFGGALLAATGDARLLAALAAGGAAAQLYATRPRLVRATAGGSAAFAAALLLNLSPVMLAGAAASALLAAPVPEMWTRAFARLGQPLLAPDDPRRQAEMARRRSAGRLRDLGAAFGELAEGFLEPADVPDEQALLLRLRESLCDGCGGYGACWAGARDGGARLLCELIARAAMSEPDAPLFDGEATPELLRRCRRGRLLPERAGPILADFAETRRAALRNGARDSLVAAQLSQARHILEGLAGRLARPEPAPRPRLRVECGAACASREAGVPSGDSHLICRLDGCRQLALICDGMGSGADAARESRLAARLLGRFLRAGTPVPLAVETVNALLMRRGGEDMFATADILLIDLSTGEAAFVKLGACPTWIARGGEALRVEGGRLPLGILEGVSAEQTRARLEPGDAVLMVSDGVLDALGDGALEALLLDNAGDDPRRLAERTLAAAEAACVPARRDDMTAVAVRVWSLESGVRR